MAKEPKKAAAAKSESLVEQFIKKEYGNDIFKSARAVAERKWDIIPVCPSINIMLGGGIPTGTWMNIGGKPKCGKTTTTLWTCKKAIESGMEVYYLNAEHRLKPMNFEYMSIDWDKFHVIESSEDKILSAQDFLTIGEQILHNTKKSLLVIDSLAALAHEKELAEGIGTSTRGGSQALVAQFVRQMTAVVPIKQHIVITIQQIQANTSGYGPATILKGGYAIAFQGDIIMRERGVQDWKVSDKIVGQKVTWEVDCTALGGFPGTRCESFLRYGAGLDELTELVSLAKSFGLISGSTWLLFDFVEDHLKELGEKEWDEETQKKYKTQGQEAAMELLKQNDKLREILEKDLLTTINGK